MKRKMLLIVTILLVFSLPINMFSTYSSQNHEEENLTINEYDYSNWYWTGTELISDMSSSISENPTIITDNEKNIHAVWSDSEDYEGSGTDYDIFYRKWSSSSKSWSPTELVTTTSTGNSNNPKIDVDSENNIHLVWDDFTDLEGSGIDRDVFYQKRNAVTNTWGAIEVVSSISTGSSYYSDIAIDQSDNINIMWFDNTDYNGSDIDYDIFYKQWENDLSSWSETFVVSTESTSNSHNSRICVDSIGNIFFVWDDYTNYDSCGTDRDIFFKYRTSGGSWSPLIVLSHFSTLTSQIPTIDCNEKGLLSVVWAEDEPYLDSGTDTDVYHMSYSVNSNQWSEVELISDLSDDMSFEPGVSVDIFGNVQATWYDPAELGGSGNDLDIHYRIKDSESQLWSPIYIVSSGNNYHDSWNPIITTDDFGYAHVLWQDVSDIGGAGSDSDIFYNKFVGPPEKPILASFAQNPDTIGDLNIDWSDCLGATVYDIYREESYIWSVLGLTPIENVSSDNYVDSINYTGTYYYSVVAKNDYGNSELSNVESLVIQEDESQFGFFESLRIGEIFVLAAIIGGVQIVLSVITYALLKTRSAKTGKKKN